MIKAHKSSHIHCQCTCTIKPHTQLRHMYNQGIHTINAHTHNQCTYTPSMHIHSQCIDTVNTHTQSRHIHSQATYTVKAYTQAMHIHSHGTTGTLARFFFAYQVRFCKLVPNLYEGIEQITFLMNDEKIAEFVVWVDSLRIRLCSEKYTC